MSFSPAYHLRTNKAVERLLFLELLRKLDGKLRTPIARYQYVGMGGPYLEDFGAIHGTFGNRQMISLEIQKHVRSRQVINRPHSRVNLTLDSTTDFVATYQPGRTPIIAWFDYEWPNWKAQIAESCDLLRQLPQLSIFKITLSGKTDWLDEGSAKDPMPARADRLTAMFGDYGTFTPAQLNTKSICETLYSIFHRAVAAAVPDTSNNSVRTLASFKYDDGTPILTVAVAVGAPDRLEKIVAEGHLKGWPFSDLNWSGPKQIAIPPLSLREKLAVDAMLPDATARQVLKQLRFRISKDYRECFEAMRNYVQFYRHVPAFLRVNL